MNTNKLMAMGWLIGYFVLMYPLVYITQGDLLWGLVSAIWGISIPVLILWSGRIQDE